MFRLFALYSGRFTYTAPSPPTGIPTLYSDGLSIRIIASSILLLISSYGHLSY